MVKDQKTTSTEENVINPSVENDVGEGVPTGEFHSLTEEEIKARDRRNLAVALGVVGFIALVFFTTVLRLAQNTGGAAS